MLLGFGLSSNVFAAFQTGTVVVRCEYAANDSCVANLNGSILTFNGYKNVDPKFSQIVIKEYVCRKDEGYLEVSNAFLPASSDDSENGYGIIDGVYQYDPHNPTAESYLYEFDNTKVFTKYSEWKAQLK